MPEERRIVKRNRIAIAVAAIVLLATGFWFFQRAEAQDEPAFRFAEVEQGDIEMTVSATGALSAVTTVAVGTQVSGQVSELYVDFNDRVKKGQLLARIDPTLARQAVADAQATVESRRADLALAQREYERNRQLVRDGLVAESAFDESQSRLAVNRATVKSAQVALDRARQNLAYTDILAPIDGVVVERNVDRGQTVAASLQAPQLFLIANDLSQMQILASVDESDIGMIEQGQSAKFTVQALPRETFTGTVKQVRLQSTTQDNVVSYTVVLSVSNPQGKLLPGMTANVDFLTKSAQNVLMVPNAALRFTPSDEALAEARGPRQGAGANTGTGGQGAAQRTRAAGRTRGQRPTDVGRLWYLDSNGKLAMARVKTGISNGTMTQVSGPELKPGMQVIAGSLQAQDQTSTATPFGNNSNQQPRRGPGGAF
jgi:HlyD family secretion protein